MQDFFRSIITKAAQTAGLPEGRVIDAARDNITLPRPRVELQFLAAQPAPSGRKLGVHREGTVQTRKRELYTVQQDVSASVLAEAESWLAQFTYAFLQALPAGANDARGNWVKVRAARATFGKDTDKRIGSSVIKVFEKVNTVFIVSFTWRVTAEEAARLIPGITITPHWR